MRILMLFLLLTGCSRMAADIAYDDVHAAAIADKSACDRGDSELCVKFGRAQDRCRAQLSTGSTSPAALVCKRLLDEGVITVARR